MIYKQAQAELETIRDLLRFAVSRFDEAGLFFGHGSDNAWDEAVYLVLHTLHLPIDNLTPFIDAHLTSDERAAVLAVIERRIKARLPAAYLTHEAWLGDFRFYVDERVIVPRSHIAELLREQLTPWINDPWAVGRVLDLCTGSGCLAILASQVFPNAEIDAVDLSPDALEVAAINVDRLASGRVNLFGGDLLAPLEGRRYDIIISNPPYVDDEAMADLPDEYRAEPEMALTGGFDGLDLVRRLIDQAPNFLNDDGGLLCEIGTGREALELSYPSLPFQWLDTAESEGEVFWITAADLKRTN